MSKCPFCGHEVEKGIVKKVVKKATPQKIKSLYHRLREHGTSKAVVDFMQNEFGLSRATIFRYMRKSMQ